MEIQIKKAIKSGNSSAVILPRAWLNKEVRIELIKKTPEIILEETISLIKAHLKLEEVIGIYLVGSYARQEETNDSDIDILIITQNTDREMLKFGNYNILLVSKELLFQKLKKDLFPIGPMLKEAVPLLNKDYLESIKIEATKENLSWYVKTTAEKLKFIEKLLNTNKTIPPRAVYTLILRIRTMHLIKKMIENKKYSKYEFISLIRKISGDESAYNAYLSVKNDEKEEKLIDSSKAKLLYDYLSKEFQEVKKSL